ncbi:hypothetical protein HJC23_010412 [Cyclotella cryptica]|uniref:Succinate-semialdehyde dehydrogenase, mitochondrial n=1 Tax=Cyclotella cryptica TaxID=29204 RepID=A0ABD3QHS9_9STRA|eukprot:CCRYP_005258-RA/>CCRYP_005258-RA protein AED:0.01 eAED:0.01 QI:5872/1/1/1/0.2/0.16/6/65/601
MAHHPRLPRLLHRRRPPPSTGLPQNLFQRSDPRHIPRRRWGVVQHVSPDDDFDMPLADVYGCCTLPPQHECTANHDPTCTNDDDSSTNPNHNTRHLSRTLLGKMPQFTTQQTLQALQSAISAWNGGTGTWPQTPLSQRIRAVQHFLDELQHRRQDIVHTLMWEIGKNRLDAEAEFDRTVQFAQQAIRYIQTSSEFDNQWDEGSSGGAASTRLMIRRAAVGIVLCLGPYNYPLNETYAALIPALLMGNVVILKIPTIGGLAHLWTMEAFAEAFPPGTVNLVSGSGRVTMPPLMESGKIDSLAFIGGSRAADELIKSHPEPHRLKVFLQLEAKNMGVYMSDLFSSGVMIDEERILKETIAGTLSFNGQRCTALKLLFVPKDEAGNFAKVLAREVDKLSVGLPWESTTDGKYSQITPLPNKSRIDYMKALIHDAVSKGATIMNENGGMVVGGEDSESTLMVPAVLYPVTPDMRIYEEEQFGPVVAIAEYDSIEDVLTYAREGKYGQQVSIFTAAADDTQQNGVAQLVDRFSTVFGKININSQCGRSPDTAPFSGRRSSAMGVMSVMEALHEFSIPTVVSYKDEGLNSNVVHGVEKFSSFLQPVM